MARRWDRCRAAMGQGEGRSMADTNMTRRFAEALARQREALGRAGLTEQEQDRAMQPAESFVATIDEEESYRWYLARGYSEYEARDLVWGQE